MTESNHTPGPWVARQEFANRWRIESHAKGPEFIPISVGLACTTILEVGCGNEDTAANAQLIAAAPRLLDALRNLVASNSPEHVGEAIAAIAVAEGASL